jgi:carbamate kinase
MKQNNNKRIDDLLEEALDELTAESDETIGFALKQAVANMLIDLLKPELLKVFKEYLDSKNEAK